LPLHELARSGTRVPGPALGALRLELEQVLRQRPLEAGERGLDTVGGSPQGCLSPTWCCRDCVSPPPALEQPAEGERRRLAGTELGDEAPGGELGRGVAFDDWGPTGQS
jgi:hypothetical protein